MAIPNTKFKFTSAKHILISRNGTLKDLETKIIRSLN